MSRPSGSSLAGMASGIPALACCVLIGFSVTVSARAAQEPAGVGPGLEATRVSGDMGIVETPVVAQAVPAVRATITSLEMTPAEPAGGFATRGLRACPQLEVTHSGLDFAGSNQSVIIQGGFVETEIAAATYTVEASEFPITVNTMEMVFALNRATVQTTTHWSVMVWEGPPSESPLVTFSSDDVILPHIVMPPSAIPLAVLVSVTVDPEDPDQIVVQDDGSHSFSVGFRIDQHHAPATSSCCFGLIPQPCCPAGDPPCDGVSIGDNNVFPTVDTDGDDFPSQNWLRCRSGCGALACPGGWHDNDFVGMSGDWNIRAFYTPFDCADLGACCLTDGSCQETIGTAGCSAIGGTFQGIGSSCATAGCPQPPGACCDPETNCTDSVQEGDCQTSGFAFFPGQQCSGLSCPAPGACCDFSAQECFMVSPSICALAEGVYQGHGTTCGLVDCTEPPGACCDVSAVCTDGVKQSDCQGTFDTFFELQTCSEVTCPPARGACCNQAGGCLQFQSQDFCENTLGGTYAGDGTNCDDQVCDPGACCLLDGSCQEIIEAECDALGGAFGAVGSGCATAGCPQPPGACCVNQTCVPGQLEADCISFNGTWVGPFTDCGPPDPCAAAATIVGASSCRDHGTNPPVERCLSLDTVNVEPRLGGVRKLVFQVSDPVSTVGASVACAVNTYDGIVTVTPNGTTVTVDLSSGLPDGDCCTTTLTGDVDDSFDVRILVGDANLDSVVSSADAASVGQRLGSLTQNVGAQYDINADDAISSADGSSVEQRLGRVAAACP